MIEDAGAGEDRIRNQPLDEQQNKGCVEQVQPIGDAICALHRAHETAERDRSQRERFTVRLNIFTATFAFLAATAAIYSAWVFQGQLTEMQADRRPWVKWQSIKPSQPLERIGDSLKTTVTYQLRGFGKTPALNVSFWSKLIIQPLMQPGPPRGRPANILQEARTNCEGGAKVTGRMTGTLFPLSWGVTIFPDEITEPFNMDARASDDEFRQRYIQSDNEMVIIHLLACITYASSLNATPHQTFVNYYVTKLLPDGTNGSFVLKLSELPLPTSKWGLLPDPLNAGFAN